jgi:hypothetical protein
MRARELELLLGKFTPRSKSDLDIRMRKLREAKLLPTGGRGPHAPHIGPREAATMLIAICASRQAVDAAKAVGVFSSLSAEYNEDAFHGALAFPDALTLALSNAKAAKEISYIEFHLPAHFDRPYTVGPFPFAVIMRGPHHCFYCTDEYLTGADIPPRKRRPAARDEGYFEMALSDDTMLRGEFLVKLARQLGPPKAKSTPRKGRSRRGVR